jgi:hypothetical protein
MFKIKNNLFGFRNSKGYMRFRTWQESVKFMAGWQKRKKLSSKENYYVFLDRINYAEDTTYIDKLKNF